MKHQRGSITEAKLVKAGCGFRYDPEQLGDEAGFDFNGASALLCSEGETCEVQEAKELASSKERTTKNNETR